MNSHVVAMCSGQELPAERDVLAQKPALEMSKRQTRHGKPGHWGNPGSNEVSHPAELVFLKVWVWTTLLK